MRSAKDMGPTRAFAVAGDCRPPAASVPGLRSLGSGTDALASLLRVPPDIVVCRGCPAWTIAPTGIPEGWDGVWRSSSGWSFTCPACLDRIEEAYRRGQSLSEASRLLEQRDD